MMKEIVQNQKDEMLISNPEKLNEKRSIFTKSSSDKSIFVSDFDYTFSLRFLNHIQLYSSYCFLENSLLINDKNPNFKNQLHELSLKYEHYETDTSIDFEFRKNIIKEWFEKALDLYTAQHITKKDFIEVIREAADKEDSKQFDFMSYLIKESQNIAYVEFTLKKLPHLVNIKDKNGKSLYSIKTKQLEESKLSFPSQLPSSQDNKNELSQYIEEIIKKTIRVAVIENNEITIHGIYEELFTYMFKKFEMS